jgi:hypothetical protein
VGLMQGPFRALSPCLAIAQDTEKSLVCLAFVVHVVSLDVPNRGGDTCLLNRVASTAEASISIIPLLNEIVAVGYRAA